MTVNNSAHIDLNGQRVAIELRKPGAVEEVRLELPPKPTFPPVGYCIYCGSTESLSDEHIVPYGLSGDAVLPRASCGVCARETGRFEQLVLRGPLRSARIHRRLKSRTRHRDGPDMHRLVLVRESGEEEVDVPLADYPILLHFPIFSQPGCVTGLKLPGIQMQGIQTILFGPHPEEVAKRHGAKQVRFPTTREQPVAFARMIAKIGYGYACATGQTSRIDGSSPVVSCIRGMADDVGQWVFTENSRTVSYPGLLHRIVIHEIGGSLVAEVHLFADSQTPRYGVVLGRLKADDQQAAREE